MGQFQSTRPIRGATAHAHQPARSPYVSIHAPHTRRDFQPGCTPVLSKFQSTRPIRGATVTEQHLKDTFTGFNPRAPYEARLPTRLHSCAFKVSIHAPHTRRDCMAHKSLF